MTYHSSSLRLLKKVRVIVQSRAAWLLLAVIGAGIASNLAAFDDGSNNAAQSKRTTRELLMREGTRVESKRCECRVAGDRLVIQFDDTRTIEAVPNLAAQRIFQACCDDSSDCQWVVSGRITEFQNLNYMLLENIVRAPNH